MANILKGKKIVLGITGSIAAYKACYIIRGLIKRGAEVQVVITPAGKEFITPITLSALTSKPVISEFFAQRDGTWNSHVDLGLWADAMLIAPGYGFHHRQDGEWCGRQYADYHHIFPPKLRCLWRLPWTWTCMPILPPKRIWIHSALMETTS